MALVQRDNTLGTRHSCPPPSDLSVADDDFPVDANGEKDSYDPESGKRIGMRNFHAPRSARTIS